MAFVLLWMTPPPIRFLVLRGSPNRSPPEELFSQSPSENERLCKGRQFGSFFALGYRAIRGKSDLAGRMCLRQNFGSKLSKIYVERRCQPTQAADYLGSLGATINKNLHHHLHLQRSGLHRHNTSTNTAASRPSTATNHPDATPFGAGPGPLLGLIGGHPDFRLGTINPGGAIHPWC